MPALLLLLLMLYAGFRRCRFRSPLRRRWRRFWCCRRVAWCRRLLPLPMPLMLLRFTLIFSIAMPSTFSYFMPRHAYCLLIFSLSLRRLLPLCLIISFSFHYFSFISFLIFAASLCRFYLIAAAITQMPRGALIILLMIARAYGAASYALLMRSVRHMLFMLITRHAAAELRILIFKMLLYIWYYLFMPFSTPLLIFAAFFALIIFMLSLLIAFHIFIALILCCLITDFSLLSLFLSLLLFFAADAAADAMLLMNAFAVDAEDIFISFIISPFSIIAAFAFFLGAFAAMISLFHWWCRWFFAFLHYLFSSLSSLFIST